MFDYRELPFKSFLDKNLKLGPLLLLAVVGGSTAVLGAGFRASVVKIDITPSEPQWLLGYGPRKSDGVHDHLFHRIIAMDDGKTQFFLISTDICLVSPSTYDDVARAIEEHTGVKPIQVWWTVTHTHAAPEVGPPGLGAVFMGSRYQHTRVTRSTRSGSSKSSSKALKKLERSSHRLGWEWVTAWPMRTS